MDVVLLCISWCCDCYWLCSNDYSSWHYYLMLCSRMITHLVCDAITWRTRLSGIIGVVLLCISWCCDYYWLCWNDYSSWYYYLMLCSRMITHLVCNAITWRTRLSESWMLYCFVFHGAVIVIGFVRTIIPHGITILCYALV